jgi:CubicO group peptidase (beta-lactamase class C family)
LRTAFVTVSLFAALAGRVVAQDDAAALIARVEAAQTPARGGLDSYTLQELMQRFRVPGVSIAVIKDFEIHWAKAYGQADVESQRPVDTNTMFQAASISKPVAAVASLKLVQEGRFALDDDINKILKSWKVPSSELTREQPVTPRALLSHSSGADDGFGFPGYDPNTPVPTLVQIFEGQPPSNVGAVRFGRPVFQGYKYSGGGVTIMQLAVMDVTGKPFAEYMQANVLGPIGMNNSSYEQPLPAALAARAARAHNAAGRPSAAPWHVYPEQAAAGLWTTPSDLARFMIEVQRAYRGPRGAVLRQASAREMIAPVGVGPFAVGFTIERRGEGWYFMHGGSNWGFRANVIAHVRNGYGSVIMTNGDNGGQVIVELESRIANAYNWDSLHKPLLR